MKVYVVSQSAQRNPVQWAGWIFARISSPVNHDIEHALAAAQKHATAGQFDDAARLLHGILASVPDHGEALEGLGYIRIARHVRP